MHPMTRQRQALLRNNDAPAATAFQLIKLIWYWRAEPPPIIATSLLSLAGLFFSGAVIIIGILSSNVIDTRDVEVLLVSENCGAF
jgi:hypothetical protein